jgi:hypothetical protein
MLETKIDGAENVWEGGDGGHLPRNRNFFFLLQIIISVLDNLAEGIISASRNWITAVKIISSV